MTSKTKPMLQFLHSRGVSADGRKKVVMAHADEILKDWHEFIHTNPNILQGKPVIRGTRLGVDLILRLLAAGWTEAQVLDSYPTLTPAALRAVYAYASEAVLPGERRAAASS
jgi:uncharacterized protein (DUF433 family)